MAAIAAVITQLTPTPNELDSRHERLVNSPVYRGLELSQISVVNKDDGW